MYPIKDLSFVEEVKAFTQNHLLEITFVSTALNLLVERVYPLSCNTIVKPFARIGLLAGIASVYSLAYSTVQYGYSHIERNARIHAFSQLQDVPDSLQKQLAAIKEFIQMRRPLLGQDFQRSAFHHSVTTITSVLQNNTKAASRWKKALDSLNGMQVDYPDQSRHSFDFSETSIEQKLLGGAQFTIQTAVLDSNSSTYFDDLKQIGAISYDCFSYNDTVLDNPAFLILHKFPRLHHLVNLLLSPLNINLPLRQFVVARDALSNKILGFIWYNPVTEEKAEESSRFSIRSLGRSPGAAHMGIGKLMFDKLIESHPKLNSLELEVRKSNESAIALYQRVGFVVERIEGDFYKHPTESALIMKFEK